MKKRRTSHLIILLSLVMFIGFSLMASFVIRQEFQHIDQMHNDHLLDIAHIVSTDDRVITMIQSQDMQINDIVNQYLIDIPELSLIEIVTMDSIRLSHVDDIFIGQLYQNDDLNEALLGKEYIVTEYSSLGESRKAFIPIQDHYNQVGVAIVEMLVSDINEEKAQKALALGGGFLLGYIFSVIGLYLLSKRYVSELLGYNPGEISMLFAEQKSIIDQLGEGIITVDQNLKILTINNAMKRMFSLTDDVSGKDAEEIFPYVDFRQIMEEEYQIEKKYRKINDNKYLMDAFPLYHNGKIIGASAIFRVHHEIDALIDQLDGYRQINEGLRSQKHELQNKLHVILGLIKMKDYKEAENYIMENVYTTNLASDYYTSRLKDDKVIALFVGKEMQCKEHAVTLLLTSDSYMEKSHLAISSDDVLLVLGNLIDNALEAYEISDTDEKRIVVDIFEDEEKIRITVIDQAGGIDPKIQKHMFERGIST